MRVLLPAIHATGAHSSFILSEVAVMELQTVRETARRGGSSAHSIARRVLDKPTGRWAALHHSRTAVSQKRRAGQVVEGAEIPQNPKDPHRPTS